jgi:uncharacterized delta-60 repeat protein
VARYLADGQLDRSFGSGGVVVIRSNLSGFVANALAVQSDGKIVIAGMNSNVSTGTLQLAAARYNTDGTPDTGFGNEGMVTTPVGDAGAEANTVAIQPDGKLVVAGTAYSHGTIDDEFMVARYTAVGTLDSSFGTAGVTTTHVGRGPSSAAALALQPDGRIVVVGTAFSNGPTDDDFAVARYTFDGHLDAGFGGDGIVTTDFGSDPTTPNPSLDRANALALSTDGAILAAGFTRGDHAAFAVAKYKPDGTPDSTFGQDGKAQIPSAEPQVFSLILPPSGDIVLGGSSASADRTSAPFTLVRLHSDGSPDETFGNAGVVTTAIAGSRSGARTVVAQPDGKLITGGAKFGAPSAQGDALPESGFALARYHPDGSADEGFGADGRALTDLGDAGATAVSLALQPDGKILAAGLVFFQTQPAGPPTVLNLGLGACAFAGLVLLGGLAVAIRRSRSPPG